MILQVLHLFVWCFWQKLDELRKSWATHKSYLAKDRLVCGLVTWEGILQRVGFFVFPKTNSSPLKIGNPKIKLVFQPSIFRGCISFREGKTFLWIFYPEEVGFQWSNLNFGIFFNWIESTNWVISWVFGSVKGSCCDSTTCRTTWRLPGYMSRMACPFP